jgi:uncharacterized membrane protein (DUF4010 family)
MGLVPVALLAVSALAALSHWKSRARDPGLTTEMALIVTYLVGVLAVQQPALGAGAAALLAALLAARDRLHRFATRLLSEAELHDALCWPPSHWCCCRWCRPSPCPGWPAWPAHCCC